MEHRLCKRSEVVVDVVIYYKGQLAVRGKIRNLSWEGMFIETAPMICPAYVIVEVGLVACNNGVTVEQRLRAYAVHQTSEGVGVMFLMPSEEQLCGIDRLNHEYDISEFNTQAGDIL